MRKTGQYLNKIWCSDFLHSWFKIHLQQNLQFIDDLFPLRLYIWVNNCILVTLPPASGIKSEGDTHSIGNHSAQSRFTSGMSSGPRDLMRTSGCILYDTAWLILSAATINHSTHTMYTTTGHTTHTD